MQVVEGAAQHWEERASGDQDVAGQPIEQDALAPEQEAGVERAADQGNRAVEVERQREAKGNALRHDALAGE